MGREKAEWLSNLAENVRMRRESLKLSQQALAERSRLSINTVAKIETAKVDNPTLDTIEALGQALEEKSSLNLLNKR